MAEHRVPYVNLSPSVKEERENPNIGEVWDPVIFDAMPAAANGLPVSRMTSAQCSIKASGVADWANYAVSEMLKVRRRLCQAL